MYANLPIKCDKELSAKKRIMEWPDDLGHRVSKSSTSLICIWNQVSVIKFGTPTLTFCAKTAPKISFLEFSDKLGLTSEVLCEWKLVRLTALSLETFLTCSKTMMNDAKLPTNDHEPRCCQSGAFLSITWQMIIFVSQEVRCDRGPIHFANPPKKSHFDMKLASLTSSFSISHLRLN